MSDGIGPDIRTSVLIDALSMIDRAYDHMHPVKQARHEDSSSLSSSPSSITLLLMDIVKNVLAVASVPRISANFVVFKLIWQAVQKVQASQEQFRSLAYFIAQLLLALDQKHRTGQLSNDNASNAHLDHLRKLLNDISGFVRKEATRDFLGSLLTMDERIAQIEAYHRRIGESCYALQLSTLLNTNESQSRNDDARKTDQQMLHDKLTDLEADEDRLIEALNARDKDTTPIAICLQRRLEDRSYSSREREFFSFVLQCFDGFEVEVENWMITSYEVEFGYRIGVGGFGEVYKGVWNKTQVAIKVFKTDCGITPSPTAIRREIETWSTMRHTNILQFFGANEWGDKPFIVMPYMKNGNARDYIRADPECNRLQIIYHVSLGLVYLHAQGIVHGDLKGLNVLIDDGGNAVLCDFGLSRIRADVTTRTMRVDTGSMITVGSRNWMAPERLLGGTLKKPSDIYALGMTIYEIFTNEVPLRDLEYPDFIELVAKNDVRPERPDGEDAPDMPDVVWGLAEQCWVKDSKKRPTAKAVSTTISQMLEASEDTSRTQHPRPSPGLAPPGATLSPLEHNSTFDRTVRSLSKSPSPSRQLGIASTSSSDALEVPVTTLSPSAHEKTLQAHGAAQTLPESLSPSRRLGVTTKPLPDALGLAPTFPGNTPAAIPTRNYIIPPSYPSGQLADTTVSRLPVPKELEEQKRAEARRRFLSQMLSKRTVAHTAYDEQGRRPCDSDTRVDILADIKKWVYDVSDDSQNFLWLTGDPGSGKSAITASFTRECKDNGILWAQFFINRNIGNTTNPASYFPSIARQLADHSPDVGLAIHDALKKQPSLMDDISQHQAGGLFVKSLKVASAGDLSKPVVIIIDGLDETDTTRLRFTADVFSKALVDLPSNTKVFISSRTEDDIRTPFSTTFHTNRVKHVHLDTSAESSIRDVSAFLMREIADIATQHNLDLLKWPGEERMRGLCGQASGLFIWAVTAVKFIRDQVEEWGSECLDAVLDELNAKGMGDINVLYGTILRMTHKEQKDPWTFERFRQIVGCIMVLQEPLCLADIKSLLDLRKTLSAPVDIEHYVRRLRAVLVAGTDAIDGQTIPRFHKSFFEFITSERADPRFRINMDKSNGEVAIQCLHQFLCFSNQHATATNDANQNQPKGTPNISWLTRDLAIAVIDNVPSMGTDEGCFPVPLRYAVRFWRWHLPQAQAAMAGVVVKGSLNLPELQKLIESSTVDDAQPSSIDIASLPDGKQIVSSWGDTVRVWDAASGQPTMLPFEGHTDIVFSAAFSPDGKQVVSGSWDKSVRLWGAASGRLVGEPFEGHTGDVNSVAFSPDGKLVVSGSADKTVRLWDVTSGQPVGQPLNGHSGCVLSVAFSPNGKQVVSGSRDNTIRLWNVASGQPIGKPSEGHTERVWSVAFSPDGKLLVSGSWDNTIRLWDAASGQPIGKPFRGHTERVWSVAFSPDGKLVLSGSSDNTVRLWDVARGRPFGKPFEGHTERVSSVAFSPNGSLVVSGSADYTIRLWDVASGQPIAQPFEGHTGWVQSVAFSPDGKLVLSGSYDRTARLWDVASGQPIEFPCKGHTDRVTSVVTSLDGRNIVSASLDDTVRIWSARTGHPIGSPLKGNTKGFISLAVSPDGTQIAAASIDRTIWLWDAESHKLVTSYRMDHTYSMTSIAFSPNGKRLMTSNIDGTIHTWSATTGKRIKGSPSSYTTLKGKELFFNMERGWCRDEIDGTLLQWIPVDNPEFGVWAYIDGKVIRTEWNGSTTIVDLSKALRKKGPSA